MNWNPSKLIALLALVLLSGTSRAQLDQLLSPVDTDPRTATANPSRSARQLTHILNAETFISELEKELSKQLGLNGDLKLTLAQPWKPIKLPAADFAITIMEAPTNGISGTFLTRLKVISSGETVSDLQVSLRAQLWQDVWTAATRLERGQALDRSLLSTTRIDVLPERQPPLLAEIDPSGLEVAQTVTASRPLTKRDVVGRPLIRKGQVVEVIAQEGPLAISMKALALENGTGGDLIKLRNIESHKEFTAQILNESKVQVHF